MIISILLNSGKLVQSCLRNNGAVATEKRAPIVSIIGINQIHHHILQSEQKLFNYIDSNFLSSPSHRFGAILTKRTKTRMVNICFSISMKEEHIFSISLTFFHSQESWAKKNGTECWTPQGCRQAGLDEDIQQSIIYVAHSCTIFPCYLGMEIYAETPWTTTKIVELGN